MSRTIVAIATAHGIGSIAIIRLSGARSLEIAKTLSGYDDFKPRHATLTSLYNSDNQLLDEALVLFFKAPQSFTAEDVVEFQCHGGLIVAQQILQATLDAGAELATPGEFSKRAFLNGRIDLSEAEAIAQLIEAKSEDAAAILAKQMKGSLREYIEQVRDELLHILAYSEVSIDYAEEDLPEDLIAQMMNKLKNLHVNLSRTLEASKSRVGLMQGFKVSIIGKPNVGKSSLLNSLLNYNRAIVSDIAGTTRDTIEEQVKIGSHLIKIVDTAGIREAGDEIERIGIERSINAIKESDIVIALFDGSRSSDDEDKVIMKLMRDAQDQKELIVVINKSDLVQEFDKNFISAFSPIELSCKASTNELIAVLKNIMDSKNSSDEVMLISTRQVQAVSKTLAAIEDSYEPLQNQELEIFSFNLNVALHEIASITRPFENDEMLDKMFGNFCLGK